MARLQILQLPEGTDDDRPPFLLVVDECQPQRVALGSDTPWRDYWQDLAAQVGARGVIVTPDTVAIPANETSPVADDPERAGTREIVYAHERTRLDLCSALLVSGDMPWRKLVELVAERQRELAGLYRKLDEQPEAQLRAESLHAEARADLTRSENARDELRKQRDEARLWARHGYEIGQRHCSWTDHGVAPAWLTEGWPHHFDSCEHLARASEYDEALTRVRNLSTEPEVMNADQRSPEVWRHGYRFGILAAKSATRPRNEKTSKP